MGPIFRATSRGKRMAGNGWAGISYYISSCWPNHLCKRYINL